MLSTKGRKSFRAYEERKTEKNHGGVWHNSIFDCKLKTNEVEYPLKVKNSQPQIKRWSWPKDS